MKTEERDDPRNAIIELNDHELEAVTGGDKKPGGTAAPKEYLTYKLTEVFISSIN